MFGDAAPEDEEGGEMVKPAEPKDADKNADEKAEKDSEDGDDHDEKADGEDEDKGHEDKESPEEEEAEHEDDDSGNAKEMFMKKGGKKDKKEDKKEDKKCKTCSKCPCTCKKMKKEDQEFWNSLQNMAGMPDTKNWDGWSEITSVTQGIRQ